MRSTKSSFSPRSMGLTQSGNFLTQNSSNGKSSIIKLVMTNLPAHVSCCFSVQIGLPEQVLVRVSISPAIFRDLPRCQRVWQFIQADEQGLQPAISLSDWSISATLNIVTATGTECIIRGLIPVCPRKSRTWGYRSRLTLWYGGLL